MRLILPAAAAVVVAIAAILAVAGCSTNREEFQQPQPQQPEPGGDLMPDALSAIKWFGHASFMLTDEASGNSIYYVDPHEFDKAAATYKKADIIFITHAHFDHCDSDAVKKIVKADTVIAVPSGCKEKLGIEAEFVDVAPNKDYEIRGFKFRTVPAYNTKPDRLQYHPRSNNWVGYVFTVNSQTVYHAGDTDFIEEMKSLGKISVALLPIGGTYTMDVDEAIAAANAIKADVTIPMHYRNLLKEKSSAAEEKFKASVKNSKVVILEEVA